MLVLLAFPMVLFKKKKWSRLKRLMLQVLYYFGIAKLVWYFFLFVFFFVFDRGIHSLLCVNPGCSPYCGSCCWEGWGGG